VATELELLPLPTEVLWLPVVREAALPAVLPVLAPTDAPVLLLLVLPEAALPAVLPVLAPTDAPVLLLPVLPAAALPAVLPVLAPTRTLLVVAVLPVVVPVLAPVLSLSESASCIALPLAVVLTRSSPLPVLPPATSPWESELFSPASLCWPVDFVSAAAPALALALTVVLA